MLLGQGVVVLNWGGFEAVFAIVTAMKNRDTASLVLFPPMTSPKLVDDVPIFESKDAACEWLESQAVVGTHVAYKPEPLVEGLPQLNLDDLTANEARLTQILSSQASQEEGNPLPVITGRLMKDLSSLQLGQESKGA